MPYFMGVDLGTSGVKALIADETGRTAALASAEYDIAIPRIGWAEQDMQALWDACADSIRRALRAVPGAEIAAVGLSGQMHGLIALDREKMPVRPAIIWADQRSAEQAETLRRMHVERTALNPAAAGFLLPSLMWVKQHEPEIYGRIAHVMLPKDYIRLRLCGEIATDPTDASGTLAYDVQAGGWSEQILNSVGIDRALFPQCVPSKRIVGGITRQAAEQTGLKPGTPVAAGGGDGPMQLLGNGVVHVGMLAVNIGTASQVDLIADAPLIDPEHRIQMFCHAPENRWIAMGASLNGGGTLKWLRRTFFDESTDYRALDELAARIPAGSEGLLALPYLCGERSPHMDSHARGVFAGFTLAHTRAHLARAVMEGVVFSLRESMEVFETLTPALSDSVIASGGGARSRLWRQMQADILKKRIFTTQSKEEACLGAAMTAAVGTGFFSDWQEAAQIVRQNADITEPNPQNFARYDECFANFRELYRNNKTLFPKMQ